MAANPKTRGRWLVAEAKQKDGLRRMGNYSNRGVTVAQRPQGCYFGLTRECPRSGDG